MYQSPPGLPILILHQALLGLAEPASNGQLAVVVPVIGSGNWPRLRSLMSSLHACSFEPHQLTLRELWLRRYSHSGPGTPCEVGFTLVSRQPTLHPVDRATFSSPSQRCLSHPASSASIDSTLHGLV